MRARPISVGLLSFIVLIIVGFASTQSVLSAGHRFSTIPLHCRETI